MGTTTVERTERGTPELARRCGKCGQVAPCRSIVSRTVNGISTGSTYHHHCQGCGRAFTVISTWNTITHALGALTLFGVCCFYLNTLMHGPAPTLDRPVTEQPILAAGAGLLMVLAYGAWIVWKALAGSRNPLLSR